MGLETIAILAGTALGAGAQWWQAGEAGKAAKAQNRESQRRQNMAGQFMQGGPSQVEQMLQQFLQNMEAPEINLSNDPIFQMLNADAGGQQSDDAMDILRGIATTGDPTDPTALFESLAPIEERARNEGLAEIRGPVSGLGQRFGSAQRRTETDFLSEMLQAQSGRREQAAVGLSESAAGRRLGAAEALMQAVLGQGNLDVQRAGVGRGRASDLMNALLTSRGQQLGGFGQLLGAEQNRGALNNQVLSMMLGMPFGAQAGFTPGMAAQETASMVQFLPLLLQLMGGGGGNTESTVSQAGADELWGLLGG